MARMAELVAREEAEKARYLAQVRSAKAALGTASLGNTLEPKAGSLWAALSINHAIFKAGQTEDLRIEFTLVNDDDKVIDTKIQESRIKINSEELADSALVLGASRKMTLQGVVARRQSSIQFAPRRPLQTPGTYRVSWKGLVSNRRKSWFGSCPRKLIDHQEAKGWHHVLATRPLAFSDQKM